MTDKIKFCPQCNSTLFEDMMSCCVCGYEYPDDHNDLVPVDAYGEVDEWIDEEPVTTEASSKVQAAQSKRAPMSMSIDCGDCQIDISVHPKQDICWVAFTIYTNV